MFTRKGMIGTMVAGVLAGGAVANPSGPAMADDGRLPVTNAAFRVGQPAAARPSKLISSPAVASPSAGKSALMAEMERWRGGGPSFPDCPPADESTPAAGESPSTVANLDSGIAHLSSGDRIGVPVKTAIYRVEKSDPDELASTDSTEAEDETASTDSGVKFDLVRWGRRWGWGGGWGGRRFGWGGGFGYRRFGWGGGFYGRRFGWGGGFYGRRFYRPWGFRRFGFGYPMYAYGYGGMGGYGYGGMGGYGGYGYPMYGGGMYY